MINEMTMINVQTIIEIHINLYTENVTTGFIQTLERYYTTHHEVLPTNMLHTTLMCYIQMLHTKLMCYKQK
jgi:hypothetical protein